MHLNWTISANGMTAPKTHGAGGAGGTILLAAKSFDGTGAKLSANGGNGAASFGCGGGGGRIALLSPGLTPAKVHELSLRNTPGSLEELTSAAWPDLSATLTVNPGARGSNYADQKLASEGSMFYGSLIEGTVFILR